MDYLDELIAMPDSVARKILVDNIYTNKYILLFKNDIIKRSTDIVRGVFLDNYGDQRLVKLSIPLSYTRFSELKYTRKFRILNTCSNEIFNKYVKKQCSLILDESQFEVLSGDDFTSVILYYPEIVITNSVESSHTMKDLYLKIYFDKTNKKRSIVRISLIRATLSSSEISSNYMFSHCGGETPFKWSSSLCYGNTDLKNIVENFEKNMSSSVSELVLMLGEYLKWESLEGVPYKCISDIKKSDIKSKLRSAKVSSDWVYIAINYINKSDILKELKYSYIPDGVSLDTNSIELIRTELTNQFPEMNAIFFENESWIEIQSFNKYAVSGLNLFTFKGKEVISNITEENECNVKSLPMLVNVGVLNGVVSHMNNTIYDYLINAKLQETI